MFDKTELKEALSKCIANVTFTKKDGTARCMAATLMPDHLPAIIAENNVAHVPRVQNDEVLAVWDLDNKAWRSFRLDSITKIDYIGVDRV